MGNQQGSLKKHLETAEKTGALNFTEKNLEKFPPELFKVQYKQSMKLCSKILILRLRKT